MKDQPNNTNQQINLDLELNFVGATRLFALIYTHQDAAARSFKAKRYYLPKGIINYYVIISGKNFMINQLILI